MNAGAILFGVQCRRLRSAGWLAVCAAFALVSRPALAQTVAATPLRGGGPVSTFTGGGLNLSVDPSWVPGGAYCPMRVVITPLAPVVADRQLSIRFQVMSPWSRGAGTEVRQDVEVSAGSGPLQVDVAVPGVVGMGTVLVRVYEDGEEVKGLSGGLPAPGRSRPGIEEPFPHMLIVGSSADTAQLAAALDVNTFELATGYRAPVQPGGPLPPVTVPTAVTCPSWQLPERWIEYTGCDLILIPLADLDGLRASRPKVFRAILDWAAAGGNLCVYGIGSRWQRLEDMERLLGMTAKVPGRTPEHRGWIEPDKRRYSEAIRNPAALTQGNIPVYASSGVVITRPGTLSPSQPPAVRNDGPPPKQPPFLIRPYDHGLIVAMAANNPWPGRPAEWRWLLNSIEPYRWLWQQRHGLSLVRHNPDYWNFLITGVGLPPVNTFRVLITLFVLAIGPANFYFLRRAKRLHYLTFTIPLGAALVTLGLVGYAVVADGLGNRVRVRSVTILDQTRTHAACWARLSYYAGMTPAGGLTFPEDVAVLPLEYVPTEYDARRRLLVWDRDQHLASGWLPARTPTQFLTIRSRSSAARLEIGAVDEMGNLPVTNRLGAAIREVALHGPDGKLYTASNIEPDQTVLAQPDASRGAADRLSALVAQEAPMLPANLNASDLANPYYRGYRRFYGYNYGSTPNPTQALSRLEAGMNVAQQVTLVPDSDARPYGIGPRSYVAVLGSAPEVVVGLKAREESSLHVLLGRW